MSRFRKTMDEVTRVPTRAAAATGIVLATATWCLLTGSAQSAELGPKELFELGGIGNDQLAELSNSEPWHDSGNEVLRRMLYRIERDVRPADLEQWSLGQVELERLVGDPEPYRLQVFQLRGRVLLAEPYLLSAKEDHLGDFASIWRCRMMLDSGKRPIEVFAARLPNAWKTGEPIEEPSGALAFFLKTSKPDDTGCAAFFLAARMAWYPPTHLGRLGMDVGLLDDVVVEAPPKKTPDGSTGGVDWNTRQLTESDHECFYQMLKVAGTAKNGQLGRWAREELAETGASNFSVVPLFNRPQTQQGRLVELRGAARRIVPVRVSEAEVKNRFGIEQYYQVYLFTEDSQDNPLVFCLRELPEGLPTGDGPDFGEELSVPGFFFKTWSYPISAAGSDGQPQRQLAPLLIGKSAVWYPARAPARLSPTAKLVGTGLIILVLGVVWWIFRQFARGDREFANRVRRRRSSEIASIQWDALDSSDKSTQEERST